MTSTIALIKRLKERAEGYRQSGPSAEHTAILLEQAATELTTLLQRCEKAEAACEQWGSDFANLAVTSLERERQRDEALKALDEAHTYIAEYGLYQPEDTKRP